MKPTQWSLFFSKKKIQLLACSFLKWLKEQHNRISTYTESALPEPNLKKGRGTETTWG
jgi:hypothetical protein